MTIDLPARPVRRLLRGRFGWFFAGRAVDIFGTSMSTVALALAVLQVSGEATDLGIVLAANVTPGLLLMLAGGVLADRVGRRGLLIAANTVSAAATGAIAVLLLCGRYQVAAVAGLSLVTGAAAAFAQPALRGVVPELVADVDLQRANALLASSRHAVRIVAPAVAGLVTATAGGGWALVVDAVSCLVAAVFFLRLPARGRVVVSGRSVLADLVAGWRIFRSLRWVLVGSVSFAVMNAVNAGPWNVLGPMLVSARGGPFGWGAVLSVRAVGLLVMSVVAVRLGWRRPLRTGRVFGVLSAVPLLALGVSGSPWVVGVAAFVGGVGMTVSAITWDSAVQVRVPREALSRVASFDDLFSFVTVPLSGLAVGPFAGWFGASRVAGVCGVVFVVAALVPLLSAETRRG
ncbi:MFS transporter [Actinoplanes sp. L3-i22]|uniref:MFS transporter n=1 Tax=Actinoplanes sp. L3-i22 TaxID=2836373 RepID=UPI001C842C50|nr:MFS transporter [Actinoplanes sp. L3-i22]